MLVNTSVQIDLNLFIMLNGIQSQVTAMRILQKQHMAK